MRKPFYFFRIGGFSLINDALERELASAMPEYELRSIDVERQVIRPPLRLRAFAEAAMRYGSRIARQRIPPRDFFPRLPVVIQAIRKWVAANIPADSAAFTFQTQSLFDASHPRLPHFLYTDHTYLANLRYHTPRPLLPVAAAWRTMENNLYQTARVNFVSSGFAAESIVEDYHVAPERVLCVHSGCNIEPSNEPAPSGREGKRILFVGVDWERKGGPELIAAFREVRKALPNAELTIVGCQPVLREPGVFILGRLGPNDTRRHFEHADVFCLPSRMDPSASVLAEAGLFALPVVATAVGGNRERVLDGRTGFLCQDDAIAGRIIQLLKDAELRRRMGLAARQWVCENFTWSAVAAKMASRIRACLT